MRFQKLEKEYILNAQKIKVQLFSFVNDNAIKEIWKARKVMSVGDSSYVDVSSEDTLFSLVTSSMT